VAPGSSAIQIRGTLPYRSTLSSRSQSPALREERIQLLPDRSPARRLVPPVFSLRALDPSSAKRSRCSSMARWTSLSKAGTRWTSSTTIQSRGEPDGVRPRTSQDLRASPGTRCRPTDRSAGRAQSAPAPTCSCRHRGPRRGRSSSPGREEPSVCPSGYHVVTLLRKMTVDKIDRGSARKRFRAGRLPRTRPGQPGHARYRNIPHTAATATARRLGARRRASDAKMLAPRNFPCSSPKELHS